MHTFNKAVIATSVFFLSACVLDEDKDSFPSAAYGKWDYTYENSCVETYEFKENGYFEFYALDRLSGGPFKYKGESYGKHQIEVKITIDNGLADCEGEFGNLAGWVGTLNFALPSATTLELYENSRSSEALGVFTKRN